MKKFLALALVVFMIFTFVACGNKPASTTAENTTASASTASTTEPATTTGSDTPVTPVEKDTVFNAFEQFNTESSSTGVWQYMFSGDNGKTFDPTTDYHDYGTYGGWHPWEGSYIGVGFNHDVEGYLELNTDQHSSNFDGMMGVLVFVAPADGKYVVTSAVWNKWEQDADLFTVAREDGTILVTKDLSDCVDIYGYIQPTDVTLKAGEKLYFYCNATGSEWVSAYCIPVIYYEPTNDDCYIIPDIPEPEVKEFVPSAEAANSATKEFSRTNNDGTWVMVSSKDGGKTWTPAAVFNTPDWDGDGNPDAAQWYSADGTGCGFNYSVENYLEANVTAPDGEMMGIAYVVPHDGEFTIGGYAFNFWGQNGRVAINYQGEDKIISDYDDGTPVDLLYSNTFKEGDMVIVHGISIDGWVSTYLDIYAGESVTLTGQWYINGEPENPDDPDEPDEPDEFEPRIDVPYSAQASWSETKNEGTWVIVGSKDGGLTWTVAETFNTPDWDGDGKPDAAQWYSADGTGAGYNYSVDGYMEANTTNNNGETMGIAFVAPADGTYTVIGYGYNAWDQSGLVAVNYEGMDITTVDYDKDFRMYSTVEMKAGGMIIFHGVSTGDWVSLYIDCYARVATKADIALFSAQRSWSETKNEGIWEVVGSKDNGKTWTAAEIFNTPDWDGDGQADAAQWYSADGTGCGYNYSVPDYLEANATNNNGEIMGIAFFAPADGNYTIEAVARNFWNQDGSVAITFNGETVVSVPYTEESTISYTADLKTGDMIVIHGVSNGDWVSCYLDAYAFYND